MARAKIALFGAVGMLLAGAAVPLSASAAPDGPSGPLAGEMRQLLKLQPGGVQVSDNAMVWEATGTVVVWPSPGERTAPKGLGSNVRRDAARHAGVEPLGDYSTLDVHGCPSGITVKDYYCFYTDINWGGRRLQFTGATSVGNAANWGFDNQTSSWVNTDTDCTVFAYDAVNGGVPNMWYEPEGSVSSYVGNSYNDRMSQWHCSP
ncbi:peptidase inhibitor family I36 protein [Kribbella sp. NPDC051936]|uniref:peptidase inhibitor family I36 protein n=1 Tax=Kribbella sp. NPDC051936 TaxID=3154946 RepID=UPI0034195DC6